jgi:hypothetical protein
MEKKAIPVNLDELCEAMDNSSYENEYYLDLDTGEILFLSEYMDDEDAEPLRDRIDDDPERYELIPRAESREGYRDMQDFIATLDNEHLAGLLKIAINSRGAFRRFKDVLLDYPEEREKWFLFRDDRMDERAIEWLDSIDIAVAEE